MLKEAVRILNERQLTLCVITGDHRMLTSTSRGIYPLYNLVKSDIISLNSAYVADRVIGLAAAMLLVAGQIKALDTEVISEPAASLLEHAGIPISYRKRVPQIMNREGNGRCPVETLATKAKDTTELMEMIEGFLKKVGMIK